jgi:hypothetical protein
MSPWVRYRRGRIRYSGRIARAPFAAWLATPDGCAPLDEATSRIRLPFCARTRAARDAAVVATVQSEMDAYLARIRDLAYADGLPRVGVRPHRLVVVPRVLVNSAAYGALARRLRSIHAFSSLDGGDAVRDFFVGTLVSHADAAIAAAMPSTKRPLSVGLDWISIGVDDAFVWRLPLLNEPPWDGHHYLLELTRDPITRAVRKGVAAAVEGIDLGLFRGFDHAEARSRPTG